MHHMYIYHESRYWGIFLGDVCVRSQEPELHPELEKLDIDCQRPRARN